ncbi:dUTP diphosphatase [candidate division WWE3 bacterium]|nr:dUTP diphosphatase [candidate division WWE3 bacterium]
MKVKIKRFDKTIPLPEYKTKGATCVDLYSRLDTKIAAGEVGYIPLNVAMEIPSGYFALLASRSSTQKLGLTPANGIGIIDSDYCGDNDELKFTVLNRTKNEIIVEKGTRIAQLIILPVERMTLTEVDYLGNDSRGGFGTTGLK